MTIMTKPFTVYTVKYQSEDPTLAATIGCSNGPPKDVGTINFVPDGAPLPANHLAPPNQAPVVYYRLSRFNDVVTTLREGNNLSIFVDDVSKVGGVISGAEQVGHVS